MIELYELIVPLSTIFALSLAFTIALSSIYYLYVNGRVSTRVVRYVLIASLLALMVITLHLIQLLPLYMVLNTPSVSTIWYLMIAAIALIILCRSILCRLLSMRIKGKEMWGVVNGVPIYVYEREDHTYDAYYDWLRRSIYFTRRLFNTLNDDERLAITYHKLGHAREGFFTMMIYLTGLLWVFILPTVASMVMLLSYLTIQQLSIGKALASIMLLIFLPIYASSVMITQWIHEHEVDVYVSKILGAETLVKALMRTEIYMSLGDLHRMVNSIDFSKLPTQSYTPYTRVLKEVTSKCFKYMIGLYREILERPLPESHPPLEFRIKAITARTSK